MRIVANLYLTWQCNFRCAHCIHECGPEVKDHMTDDQIATAVDFLHWCKGMGHDLVVVGITGGEPTMHPKFWNHVMPLLKDVKDKTKFEGFELHTNASRPIPTEHLGPYCKFFANVIVGHDPFHRAFRSVDELYLDQYTEISKELKLRKNNYYTTHPDPNIKSEWVSILRDKGRAKDSLEDGTIQRINVQGQGAMDCVWEKYTKDTLNVAFTPWHINHCGERSHPMDGESEKVSGQFHSYDMTFDEMLAGAVNYVSNHCGVKCFQMCRIAYGKFVNKDEPVLVNQPEEEKIGT